MTQDYLTTLRMADYALWRKLEQKRIPFSFELELTARCNNDCRHCYTNLPARFYPLYYVLRPARLARQYGFGLLFKRRQR